MGGRLAREVTAPPHLDAFEGEAVPRPVAPDVQRHRHQPVIDEVVLGGEGQRRVVGRQGVTDSIAAPEVDAAAGPANQRQALEIQVELGGQPRYQRALRALGARHQGGHERVGVVHRALVGAQVQPAQLAGFETLQEERRLVLRVLSHEELQGLADAPGLLAEAGLAPPEILGQRGLVRAQRVQRDANVARPRQHQGVALVDVDLRQAEVTERVLVAEVDDVGVPVFQLELEGLGGIGIERARRGVERDERLARRGRGAVVHRQRAHFDDHQQAVHVRIEGPDAAVLVDVLAGRLCLVQCVGIIAQQLERHRRVELGEEQRGIAQARARDLEQVALVEMRGTCLAGRLRRLGRQRDGLGRNVPVEDQRGARGRGIVQLRIGLDRAAAGQVRQAHAELVLVPVLELAVFREHRFVQTTNLLRVRGNGRTVERARCGQGTRLVQLGGTPVRQR